VSVSTWMWQYHGYHIYLNLTKFSLHVPGGHVWSSSGSVAICYVLLVLWYGAGDASTV